MRANTDGWRLEMARRGWRWLKRLKRLKRARKYPRRQNARAADHAPSGIVIKRLMPASALAIRGKHNISNVLAALALCRALDIPLAPLLHGLRDYRGEPHRFQCIARINGVDFIDDSKGTNVGA